MDTATAFSAFHIAEKCLHVHLLRLGVVLLHLAEFGSAVEADELDLMFGSVAHMR